MREMSLFRAWVDWWWAHVIRLGEDWTSEGDDRLGA
jgi:hypothetical protein